MREVQSLRERIARTATNRRGYRQYGRTLRRDIEAHAASRMAQGASYKQIAGELGLADATLLNWLKAPSPEPAKQGHSIGFRPVELRDELRDGTDSTTKRVDSSQPASRPVVVLPSGVRVEGISLDELPEFIARLECC
jgi:transposase-like protein